MITSKPLEELDVLDNFMINAVASDPEVGEAFCKRTLSVLLQREIGELNIVAQRMIPALIPGLRGIRMDVEIKEYVASDGVSEVHNVYDLEPHLRDDVNLPRHNRFYQARIDSRYLGSGEKNFSALPNLYVITITNYDPFGEDYMMYTIKNRCCELEELEYDDGLQFVYFYTSGRKGGNESIGALLKYFQDSTQENVTDDATREIHQYVSKVKTIPEVRDDYMRFEEFLYYAKMDATREGHEEGHAEGLAEGLAEGSKRILITQTIAKVSKGRSVPEIADELEAEVEVIQPIYNAVIQAGEGADVDTIYEMIKGSSN